MYTIFSDDVCIYDDLSNHNEYKLINPTWHREDNTSGSLTFTLPVGNAGYNSVERLKSHIYIYKNDVEVWEGRVISEQKNFKNDREITCEGALGYLNDIIQPQRELLNPTVRSFLETIISYHNSRVSADKRFTVGTVTVTHPMMDESGEDEYDDDIYIYTDFESTWDCITSKLLEKNTDKYNDKKKDLRGHIRVRKENGVRYLDYLKDYPRQCSQTIDFGINLLDFTLDYDESEYCTVLIPLGERLGEGEYEGTESYLDISDVPGQNGRNYLVNQNAVNNFGWIEHVEHFDNITDDEELYNAGVTYLEDTQYGTMQLSVSAVDLSNLDVNTDEIQMLDEIRVRSEPHGLDRLFPVTEIDVDLGDIGNTKYSLGLKDIKERSSVTYYAAKIEVNSKEVNPETEAKINEISNTVDDVSKEVEETSETVDVIGDELVKEIRRATNKETEIYSNLTVTAEEISAEVGRAKGEEEKLYSKIMMTDSEIRSEVVSQRKDMAEMRSTISQTAKGIESKVTKGQISSLISQEAGEIKLQSGRLIIESGNFTLDKNGKAVASNFVAKDTLEIFSDYGNTKRKIYLDAINENQLAIGRVKNFWDGYDDPKLADLIVRDIWCDRNLWVSGEIESDKPIHGYQIFSDVGRIESATSVVAGTYFKSLDPGKSSKSANVRITDKGYFRKAASSSKRWKNSITTDLDEKFDPEKLYELPVCQFKYNTDYIDDEEDQNYDTPVIGFIAEDVDQIYPGACDYDEEGLPEDWGMRYIIPPMLKLIQQQHKEIEVLKERVAHLEEIIESE